MTQKSSAGTLESRKESEREGNRKVECRTPGSLSMTEWLPGGFPIPVPDNYAPSFALKNATVRGQASCVALRFAPSFCSCPRRNP